MKYSAKLTIANRLGFSARRPASWSSTSPHAYMFVLYFFVCSFSAPCAVSLPTNSLFFSIHLLPSRTDYFSLLSYLCGRKWAQKLRCLDVARRNGLFAEFLLVCVERAARVTGSKTHLKDSVKGSPWGKENGSIRVSVIQWANTCICPQNSAALWRTWYDIREILWLGEGEQTGGCRARNAPRYDWCSFSTTQPEYS